MIDMNLVKDLRNRTQAGFSECKKALEEASGDFEKAIDILRAKAAAGASSREGRETKSGIACIALTKNSAAVVELLCETDFVAHNTLFIEYGRTVTNEFLKLILAGNKDFDAVSSIFSPKYGSSMGDELKRIAGVIRENLAFGKVRALVAENGAVGKYVHPMIDVEDSAVRGEDGTMVVGRKGAAVALECFGPFDIAKLQNYADELAVHICASQPKVLVRDDIDPDVLSREREIIRMQIESSNAKEEVKQRMLDGRLSAFFAETVLIEQKMLGKDGTVANYIQSIGKDLATEVRIANYIVL